MSLSKYESPVKAVPHAPEVIYEKLSDLRNLSGMRQALDAPDALQKLGEKAPEQLTPERLEQIKQYFDKMTFGEDFITTESPVGAITLRIVEREAPKCLKLAGEGTPMPLYLWVQLLPAEGGSRMKLTVGAEVNFFMKAMVEKPLKRVAEGLAELFAHLPYDKI